MSSKTEVLVILLSTILMIVGMGYALKIADLIIIPLLIKLLSITVLSRSIILFPLYFIFAAYFPVGYAYGPPDFGIIASFLESNYRESIEFTQSLPASSFVGSLLIMLCFIYLQFFCWQKNQVKPELMLILLAVLFSVSLGKLIGGGVTKVKFIDFYYSLYSSYRQYFDDKADSIMGSQLTPSWQIESVSGRYKNHVLILGESMRKDYMPAYGYPVNTMPFLQRTPGIFWDGYVSTASNTYLSVPRLLSRNQGTKYSHADNIITLANMAGIQTHWISNQGRFGEFDTSAARIAVRSHAIDFLKKGSFNSNNRSDMDLLPILADSLNNEYSGGRLYVLHLMGSHGHFCDRLNGESPIPYFSNNLDMSCYLSTYTKTDELIRLVVEMLDNKKESYSLIYLTDHGLSHQDGSLIHGSRYRENYESPLVIISSDMLDRKYIHLRRSGFHFINALAEWMGIVETGLNTHYKFFSEDSESKIEVFNGKEMIDFDSLSSDEFILPETS
ncbi:putative cell division protein [Yersinia nurmii]|uniref:Cell division protein n=1 Tax=Yersinia nurmii TaxID=685706 RepID=A0ABP1YDB2_9GAMM|nr:phosphoethanolamine transferase [Yersinia nurmii]CNE56133.1 putative cell division protein [Yersinia nurmii]